MLSGLIWVTQVAKAIPFDDTVCNLGVDNVQDAVDELCEKVATSASPGYAFGREGVQNAGAWLIAVETATNKRGIPFGLSNGSIEKVTISTENIPAAFTIQIYYHDGNLSGQTLIGSVTTTATASTEDFIVSMPVAKDHQIAVLISAVGISKPKNVGVFLVVKGDLA